MIAAQDPSRGYERVWKDFSAHRTRSTIGVATVRRWAESLPPGADILDLGCGAGVPITGTLVDMGFSLYGVDASPSLVAEFSARLPLVPVECASVETSPFFGRTFDGVVAWGLLFLLRPEEQVELISRMSTALNPGGRLLFTAPKQECTWQDVMTGGESVSLGVDAYRRLLEDAHLGEIREADDEGENHYYCARRPVMAQDAHGKEGGP